MIEFSLALFFFVYMVRHAVITALPRRLFRQFVQQKLQFSKSKRVAWLGLKLEQLMDCHFCIAFWLALPLFFTGFISLSYLLGAPVLCLFVGLVLEILLKITSKETKE
jgi:protein-S-isoprenylcysteine O-methyltransferase Ste14